MNKEILTEIKRISQLMSINEAATDEFIKGVTKSEALKLIRSEVIAAMKQDLKINSREGFEDFLKKVNLATSQGADLSSTQLYKDIYGNFAKKFGKELNAADKILVRTEIAKIMKEEGENILKQKSLYSKISSNVKTGVENVKTGVKNITTKIKKLVNGGTKELKPTVAKTSQVESQMLKIGAKEEQELIEGVTKKGWNWARTLKWAVGLGITARVLWWFFHDNDKVTAPSDIPENNSNLGGSGTSGSKYTKCSEELPIKQYCKNETIRKVQACLAMPSNFQTGNFGPITQGYLEGKGQNGTLITTETIIAVCGTNSDIAGATAGKTGYEDYTTDEIEYSDDVQNTKSDTPQPVSPSTPKSTTPTSASPSTPKSAVPFSSEIPGLQSSKKSFANRTMDSDEIE